MSRPGLRLNGVSAGYGPATVLHQVDLSVPAGPCHVISGLNGAGKTTLLHAIAGLLRTRSGSIELDGQPLSGRPAHQVARLGVRLIPQGRRVFASLTVAEHLALSYRDTPGNPWQPGALLDELPVLAARRRHRAGTLSGGEQQLLALARALLGGPRLLLADEPTEGLSPALRTRIHELLDAAAGYGAIVLITHSGGVLPTGVGGAASELIQGRLSSPVTAGTAPATAGAAPTGTPTEENPL